MTDPDLWVLSRHDDVMVALRDHTRFSSDLNRMSEGLSANPFNPAMKVPRLFARLARHVRFPRVLLTTDPPDHTVLRRKISRAFTPRVIGQWQARIREISERLIDQMPAATTVDLVRDFASPLPTTVIAEMMGIPADRHDVFKRWSDNLTDGLVADGSMVKLARVPPQSSGSSPAWCVSVRKRPGDDLISLLVTGDPETALTSNELVTFCILLLAAGNETTTNLIANSMLALFAHPDVRAELAADPLVPRR